VPDLGRAALVTSLGLLLYALVAGSFAAWKGRRRLAESAQNALVASFAATLVAAVVLFTALARHDFSFQYVADHTSRELPFGYTLTAFWGGQEGSLLLWLLVLCAYSGAAVVTGRRAGRDVLAWVVPVLALVGTFFAFMLVFISSPFATQAAAADGAGLNPSLQNPYMAIHPPMLYLGYVGLTIPFAFAMGALLARRTDERWIVATRRWTLAAWAFLGVGQLLGAHWAYVEIGWGGYYAWDPVENAALMPWLAATAFLHSVMVQEKKGMLKVWNMVLVIAAFSLCLFGDFLTRSGVVQSVHSFVQSAVGPYLLAFLAIVLAASVALLIVRLPTLRADHKLESVISREATFLFNNLLLLALAFAVLWGVVFPILSEAVRGVRATVAAPYYDFFLVIFGLPLLALTGIGPLIAWRRASPGSLMRTFRWPVISAIAGALLLWLAGLGSSPAGLTALSLCVFVTATVVMEFARGTAARRAIAGGTWPRALRDLVNRNRRRYGGYVVHLSIVLLVVGVTASSAYSTVREAHLAAGASMRIDGYTLRNVGVFQRKGPNYTFDFVRLAVSHDGRAAGVLSPGQRQYDTGQVGNEVDIRSSMTTGTDLYSILQGVDASGAGGVSVKVLVNPAVGLVWLAGVVFALGALITIWPDPREARQLARRYGELLARSEA
jgi:cytochrome c-type biogenesis protein CcmF